MKLVSKSWQHAAKIDPLNLQKTLWFFWFLKRFSASTLKKINNMKTSWYRLRVPWKYVESPLNIERKKIKGMESLSQTQIF